ncbi:MAG TPA: winged helix DNA-binding domain-containing protein [Candidatus Nanopelagicales bacterium]|nr:winged helix DNA-binding domain-containing protein [Candidatus Nanopelagicales bacterium]
MTTLPADHARALRMAALLVSPRPAGASSPASVDEIVTHLGAMQAQDNASGLWSLGARLSGATQAEVTAALERREALRTWPMRGTVHLVPSRDAHWMLEVIGSKALAGAAKRRQYLGLEDSVADRAVEIVGERLAGGRRLTRAQLLAAIEDAGVPITNNLGYHLLWYASQRGVSAIAPDVDGEQTFVLLDDWVPDPVRPSREEALALIATRYFRSHGPTTRQDFQGWTGLNATEAKQAIALAGDALASAELDGATVHLDPALLDADLPDDAEVHALPGFDEYMLGYKDRSLFLEKDQFDAVVPGGNGMFRSTLVRRGRVLATWTRSTKGKRGVVTATPLVRLTKADRAAAEKALQPWAHHVGSGLEVRWES